MERQDFIEESKNLKKITSDIDSEINEYYKISSNLSSETSGKVYDYDDAERFRNAQDRIKRNNSNIERLRTIRNCPYFGRLDLDDVDSNESRIIYIGKDGLFLNHEQRVVDWRTDIGNLFYRKDLTKDIRVNNYNYSLALRREFDIKNAELILCKTLYDVCEMQDNEDVVDSFLIDVLRDKRRDRKVTNIIRTIQQNQNDLLRKPIDDNFVIQGCAGSGKTMILLHRLSYVLYNELLKPEEIKVVTPNKYFDSQIDDLSKDLGINQINRFTVDEYYLHLLKKITGKELTEKLNSEFELDHKYLEYVYSKKFVQDITKEFNDNYAAAKDIVNSDIRKIFVESKYALNIKDDIKLNDFIKTVNDRIDIIEKEYRDEKKNNELISFNDGFENRVKLIINQIKNEITSNIKELEDSIEINNQKVEFYKSENREIKKENAEITKTIELIKSNRSFYNYDYVMSNDDEISLQIRKEITEDIDKLNNLIKERNDTSTINFIRRNSLNNQINKEKDNIQNLILKNYDSLQQHPLSEYENQLDDLNKTFLYNINTINKYNDDSANFQKDIDNNRLDIKALEEVKGPADLLSYVNNYNAGVITKIRDELLSLYTTYLDNKDKINKYKSEHENRTIDISKISDAKINKLKSIKKELTKYSFEAISRNLESKYLKNDNKIYRHVLYAKLVIATLYFKKEKTPDKLICFDEAQDLSCFEIRLFKYHNEKDCIYNFYGDINQAVFEYENIKNWKEELNYIDNLNVYYLNQNYRNSCQVTEYCNKYFNVNFVPIGIVGESDVVDNLNFNQSLQGIKNIFSTDKKKRCVIMYSERNKNTTEFMQELAEQEGFSWNAIANDKISVLPARLCKGLEFDAAMIVDFDMTQREKYICYTRALDNLIICKSNIN